MKNSLRFLSIVLFSFSFVACDDKFDQVAPGLTLTQVSDNPDANTCSILYLTNNVLASISRNGTSVTSTGQTHPVDLIDPTFKYEVFNDGVIYPVRTASVGATIPYGATGSITVDYEPGTIEANLSNPYFKGTVDFRPYLNHYAGDGVQSRTVYLQPNGNGEALCGKIYFYNAINTRETPSGAGRMSAKTIDIKTVVVSYDAAADLQAEMGVKARRDVPAFAVSQRINEVRRLIGSISQSSLASLALEAEKSEIYDQKTAQINWTQATAKAVALKRMEKAGLPRSSRLANAIAEYVKTQQTR